MSDDIPAVPADIEEEKFVDLIVCRGTVLDNKTTLSPGDKVTVPVNRQHDGVFPLRWWIQNRKAARNEEEAKRFTIEKYNGRKGGPGTPVPGAGQQKAAK